MKKLMIAAAIVCAAAVTQAASVSWESGDFTALPSCTGDGDFSVNECVKGYLWEFAAADWNSAYETSEGIWNAYKAGTLDKATALTGDTDFIWGTVTVDGGTAWKENDKVYAAVLYLHSDDGNFDEADYYMGNYGSALASDAGNLYSDLGNTVGGIDGTGATAWTSTAAVPEPTSGLLLLLGVAGLALRRRRA